MTVAPSRVGPRPGGHHHPRADAAAAAGVRFGVAPDTVLGPGLQTARRAIAVHGTISGEHGIGIGKRDLMEEQHGPAAIGAMRAIKAALDPKGILNPGKLLP